MNTITIIFLFIFSSFSLFSSELELIQCESEINIKNETLYLQFTLDREKEFLLSPETSGAFRSKTHKKKHILKKYSVTRFNTDQNLAEIDKSLFFYEEIYNFDTLDFHSGSPYYVKILFSDRELYGSSETFIGYIKYQISDYFISSGAIVKMICQRN